MAVRVYSELTVEILSTYYGLNLIICHLKKKSLKCMLCINSFIQGLQPGSHYIALELRLSCTNPSIWAMASPGHSLLMFLLFFLSEYVPIAQAPHPTRAGFGSDLWLVRIIILFTSMMTSWNGSIFHITGPLCREFIGHRWIPLTKASDAELWCYPWSTPGPTVE